MKQKIHIGSLKNSINREPTRTVTDDEENKIRVEEAEEEPENLKKTQLTYIVEESILTTDQNNSSSFLINPKTMSIIDK